MDFKKYFHQTIQLRYPENYSGLIAELEKRYSLILPDVGFAFNSKNPVDRRLNFAAYFLALIQTLEKQGENFEKIRAICLEITHAYLRPKNRWQKWLKRLPLKLIDSPLGGLIVGFMKKKTGQKGHPDGFLVEVLTDKAATYGLGYGIDIIECGICKLFKKHGALPYAAILCEVDYLTSSLAGLELIRSGTIATGAFTCDFRWRRF